MHWLWFAMRPMFRSLTETRTRGSPYERTTSSVPSVEPLSTTRISSEPYVWASADSSASPTQRAPL
jgi:hypothetical protein